MHIFRSDSFFLSRTSTSCTTSAWTTGTIIRLNFLFLFFFYKVLFYSFCHQISSFFFHELRWCQRISSLIIGVLYICNVLNLINNLHSFLKSTSLTFLMDDTATLRKVVNIPVRIIVEWSQTAKITVLFRSLCGLRRNYTHFSFRLRSIFTTDFFLCAWKLFS